MSGLPHLLVCMGVAGCGKTTLARTIAERYDLIMLDADELQPQANVRKMQRGVPLNDADRVPWMDAVCHRLEALAIAHRSCVMAHSALRRQDRERLRSQPFEVSFLNLLARRSVLRDRLSLRSNYHFPACLLNSQFDAMQSPLLESDVYPLDATLPPHWLADRAAPLLDTPARSLPEIHPRATTHTLIPRDER